MPEWLSTDNIAIGVLVAVTGGLCAAIKLLWTDNKELRADVRNAFREGIDLEHARTAELTSMSEVLSSMERAQVTIAEQLTAEFANAHKERAAVYKLLRYLDAKITGSQ